jgi:hypothetical protein
MTTIIDLKAPEMYAQEHLSLTFKAEITLMATEDKY